LNYLIIILSLHYSRAASEKEHMQKKHYMIDKLLIRFAIIWATSWHNVKY